jgi:apolipoprotein N-acyltransferase
MKKRIELKTPLLIATAVAGFALLSPRWTFPLAAFMAPALLIWLLKGRKVWNSFLVSAAILTVSNLIANYKVMPFPLILFVPLVLQISLLASVPYVLNAVLSRVTDSWISTLFFPILQVLFEFGNSFLGGGSWGSIVYTQIENLPLMQIASVTGMWGLTFIIYWFSSLVVFCFDNSWKPAEVRTPAAAYTGLVVLIVLFGVWRINAPQAGSIETVRVAGVTGRNYEILAVVYEDAFSKKANVDFSRLTQTSPELQELNKGLAAFIEDPYSDRFLKSRQALENFQDSMFHIAAREAKAGARIIAFSEALMFTFKNTEGILIRKAEAFARQNNVTLLLTLGSFIPGKPEFGSKYLENKAIMINPHGNIENIFFKNKPVPVVEPSVPGDGEIPIYNSMHGKLATSICYDADFPSLLRKAGQQKADILLLPSGDWREVSPYHANMSRLRAIENGFSILRPVSGATSIACDHTGRILASRDFYDDNEKVVSAYLPVRGCRTIYASFGNYFPWLCLAAGVLLYILNFSREKSIVKKYNQLAGQ